MACGSGWRTGARDSHAYAHRAVAARRTHALASRRIAAPARVRVRAAGAVVLRPARALAHPDDRARVHQLRGDQPGRARALGIGGWRPLAARLMDSRGGALSAAAGDDPAQA